MSRHLARPVYRPVCDTAALGNSNVRVTVLRQNRGFVQVTAAGCSIFDTQKSHLICFSPKHHLVDQHKHYTDVDQATYPGDDQKVLLHLFGFIRQEVWI